MNFQLIEEHPWITGGTIVVGGIVLFLIFRGRGGDQTAGGNSGVTYYPAATGTDPTAAALQSQEDQISAALANANTQAQTQIALGTLSANVQTAGITASQDVTNKQTAAQLQLGIGSIQGQVDLAQIQAQSQLDAMRLLVAAYTGGSSAPVTSTVTPTGGMVNQVTPPAPVYLPPSNVITQPAPVSYVPPATGAGTGAADNGQRYVVPGGTQLVPYPNLIPQTSWPDAAVVANDVQWASQWENQTVIANAQNNFASCLNDADRSKGYPNYDSIVARCHAEYNL